MMFIHGIVFLVASTEALYYVKILDASGGMGGDVFEIIKFNKPSVSRKDIWNKVNKSEYVTFRETNNYDNKNMKVQVITPGTCEKIDEKTATEDLVRIQGAEIVLALANNEYYVATILDLKSNLLDHFISYKKTTTVEEIWEEAKRHSSIFSQSIWKSVNEIHVEAPGHSTQTITKQTSENTVVQIENAKFFVQVKAEEDVKHMAPFWRAELNKESMHSYKSHKYTGLFHFHATHMTIQDIWNAVKQEVVPASNPASFVTLEELRIEMAKGTISVEVKSEEVLFGDVKDRTNKIDVTTITDVIYGVQTFTRSIVGGRALTGNMTPGVSKDDFKVEEHLSAGDDGSVYKVRRIIDRKTFAMKKIVLVAEEKFSELAEQIEIQVTATKDKRSHINNVTAVFLDENKICMLLEWIKADVNRNILKSYPNIELTENELCGMAKGMMEDLAYLEERGISHRDLDACNLFVNENNEINLVIGDFQQATKQREFSCIYHAWPDYAPPEWNTNAKCTIKVDVWAIGVFLRDIKRHITDASDDFDKLLSPDAIFSDEPAQPPSFSKILSSQIFQQC